MKRPRCLTLEAPMLLPRLVKDHPHGCPAQWPGRRKSFIPAGQAELNPWIAAVLDLARWEQEPGPGDEERFWSWARRADFASHARFGLACLAYPLFQRDGLPLTDLQALLETEAAAGASAYDRGLACCRLVQLEDREEWFQALLACAAATPESTLRLVLLYRAVALRPQDPRGLELAAAALETPEQHEEYQSVVDFLGGKKTPGRKRKVLFVLQNP